MDDKKIFVLALRSGDTWHDRHITAARVEDIFSNPQAILNPHTEPFERFNVYYTVSECLQSRGRKFLRQAHVPFDIDGIDVPPPGEEKSLEALAKIVAETLGVAYEECGVLFTGNGIHVIVGTVFAWEDEGYFDKARHHYKAICDRINQALSKAGLKGKADPAVWSPARLMRYPNTRNVKPNKPERMGVLLNPRIVRGQFRLEDASGIPLVPQDEQVTDLALKGFPKPDVRTILAECQFMKWAGEAPEQVNEPQWYAMLSIASRFPDGDKHCHNLSKGHPKYSYEETKIKIEQARLASGPRTCNAIQNLAGKCEGCAHRGKVKSPILVAAPDFVKTESTGFWHIKTSKEGVVSKTKPDVEGLVKIFDRDNIFKSVDSSGVIYVWNGTHYEEKLRAYINRYAEDSFDPPVQTFIWNEFYTKLKHENIVKMQEFQDAPKGKMNFLNGVLDVSSRTLTPHDSAALFRATLPCKYDRDAKAPHFLKFLDDITLGRQPFKDILQEFLGYTFANEGCYLHKALLLLGDGSNGKSTLMEVISALAGEEATSHLTINEMNNPQNIVNLDGKILNISEESSSDSFENSEVLKKLIRGETVTGKTVYQAPREFQNHAKLVILSNELPRTRDHTFGFHRGLVIIPFDAVFSAEKGNVDPFIASKLKGELPGIFNWIMEGYDRIKEARKFTVSIDSSEISEQYKKDNDELYAWFCEHCQWGSASDVVTREALYDNYSLWSDESGYRFKKSRQAMIRFIRDSAKRKANINVKEVREGTSRAFSHIKLLKAEKF
jgi:putative DNA primase/helicase